MGVSRGEERRQRRVEQRREQILAAAAGVFAAKGYHAATTREVAEAADVAEGTIFNYFPSKRDLLLAVFDRSVEPMLDTALTSDPEVPVREAMADRLEAVLAFYTENRLYVQAIAAEAWTDPDLLRAYALPRLQRVTTNLKQCLDARVAAGELRPIDTGLAVQLLLGMAAAVLLPIVRGMQPAPGPRKRRQVAESVVDLFVNGVDLRAEG